MMLPDGFDRARPDDELVADLVASGAYDEDEARVVVAMIKDEDRTPVN